MPIDKRYSWFLAGLSLLGLVLVLVTTSKYGAGVSSDAVRAMSTAEGLLAGEGFVDFVGAAYVYWPPLYPLLLAGLSALTRLDVFQVGWYLNVVLFPLNIWLWGQLLWPVFHERPFFAYFASVAGMLSSSMIRIYANVASDPLFVTFMLIFLLAAGKYLQTPSGRLVAWMFVMAGLGMLQRYLGIVFFGIAGLVVLVKAGWRGVLRALPLAAFCLLPSVMWLYFHNFLAHQTIFGDRAYDEMWPLENISLSTTKILHWFLPYAPGLKELLLNPWTILLPVVLILLFINRRNLERWTRWRNALLDPFVWPALLFSLVYYFLLAFTVNTIDHRDLTSDRYYIILFPVILIVLFLTIEHLVLPHVDLSKSAVRHGAIGLAALWLVYPTYDLQEYLRLALVKGEPSNYNIYNSQFFNELPLVDTGRELADGDPDATIYSNYVNALWFQFHRPIHVLLPVDNELPEAERLAILRSKYPGWPGEQDGYIIWFTPNEYKYLAEPSDLAQIANLDLLYSDDYGLIYRVSPAP